MAKLRKNTIHGQTVAATQPAVHEASVFRALIRHEKCRADRDGCGFSLIILERKDPSVTEMTLAEYSQDLLKMIRPIDEVGWMDEKSIGIMLPFTKHDGALQLIQRVSLSEHGTDHFTMRTYTYPGHWDIASEDEQESCTVVNYSSMHQVPSNMSNILCLKVPFWKRFLDLFGSTMALIMLWPLLIIVAIYIKLVSPGPVMFKHQRVGYNRRLFTFYKFRTMKVDNNQEFHKSHIVERIRSDKPLEKLDDRGDPRIIPGGRFLRKTCIDELPQLFNVLRGDMSLVGPRPCMPYEAEEFLRWHTERFDVLPGMTGLWQVSGKNKLTFLQMIRLDISYANNMSFWLDLKIILLTFPVILGLIFESAHRILKKKVAAVDNSVSEGVIQHET